MDTMDESGPQNDRGIMRLKHEEAKNDRVMTCILIGSKNLHNLLKCACSFKLFKVF